MEIISSFSKEELIEIGIETHINFQSPLPTLVDIVLVGSYCYNYTKQESDIELLLYCDFPQLEPRVRIIGGYYLKGKKLAYTLRDINAEKSPNWGPFTLPRFSLITGELTFYNKDSILDYISKQQHTKPDFHIGREYTDHYGSGIDLQREIELIKQK